MVVVTHQPLLEKMIKQDLQLNIYSPLLHNLGMRRSMLKECYLVTISMNIQNNIKCMRLIIFPGKRPFVHGILTSSLECCFAKERFI